MAADFDARKAKFSFSVFKIRKIFKICKILGRESIFQIQQNLNNEQNVQTKIHFTRARFCACARAPKPKTWEKK